MVSYVRINSPRSIDRELLSILVPGRTRDDSLQRVKAPDFIRRYQDYSERRARRLQETLPDIAAAVLTRGKFKVFHTEALQQVGGRRADPAFSTAVPAPQPTTAVKLEPAKAAIALPVSAPPLPAMKVEISDLAIIPRTEGRAPDLHAVILLDSEGDDKLPPPPQAGRQETSGVSAGGARKRRAKKEPLSVDERRRKLDEVLNLQ